MHAAQALPPFMDIIAGGVPSEQLRERDAASTMITLNDSMFDIYLAALAQYKKNLLDRHPVILGLFSTEGGAFTLYRPGEEPIAAPFVPIAYRVLKAASHSSLVLFELVGPYLNDPGNAAWHGATMAYREQTQTALDRLGEIELSGEARDDIAMILKSNLAFMDGCLKRGTVAYSDLTQFASQVFPHLRANIRAAGAMQVDHWMSVVAEWKKLIGSDWERAYGATNTLYVTRQNNVLFSVLAQFFGQQAFNDRLFLFETSGFTATPDDMLTLITRIVSDRAAGQVFFGDYFLMDYELLGGAGRKAIEAACARLDMSPLLPPEVPFGSHQWPFMVTPGEGAKNLDELAPV